MQVGEQHLVRAQHGALAGLRLLDLDDQLGALEHRARVGKHFRARRRVLLVGAADAGTGIALDEHLVPVHHELVHVGRNEADAVFARLDLLRHADFHRPSLRNAAAPR